MKNIEPVEDPQSNAFLRTLAEMRKGRTVSECSDALTELVGAVKTTGKRGVLTLKLVIDPDRDGLSVTVDDTLSCKTPMLSRQPTRFFTTELNLLQRNDPAQAELGFKTVSGGQDEPAEPALSKTVNA